jgi:hypothetical protein
MKGLLVPRLGYCSIAGPNSASIFVCSMHHHDNGPRSYTRRFQVERFADDFNHLRTRDTVAENSVSARLPTSFMAIRPAILCHAHEVTTPPVRGCPYTVLLLAL